MSAIRGIQGFFKVLIGAWDSNESAYFTKWDLDPRAGALTRWEVLLLEEEKREDPDNPDFIPHIDYKVALKDKYGLSPDLVIITSNNVDKAQAVHLEYTRQLKLMSCGNFYNKMIVHRDLSGFHNYVPEDMRGGIG